MAYPNYTNYPPDSTFLVSRKQSMVLILVNSPSPSDLLAFSLNHDRRSGASSSTPSKNNSLFAPTQTLLLRYDGHPINNPFAFGPGDDGIPRIPSSAFNTVADFILPPPRISHFRTPAANLNRPISPPHHLAPIRSSISRINDSEARGEVSVVESSKECHEVEGRK